MFAFPPTSENLSYVGDGVSWLASVPHDPWGDVGHSQSTGATRLDNVKVKFSFSQNPAKMSRLLTNADDTAGKLSKAHQPA